MGVEIVACDAVPGDGLDPFRFDRGGAARIESRRLGQLGGQHPFWRFARDARARMQVKTDPACAVVRSVLALGSDIGQKPREQRLMDRRIPARVNLIR